MRLSSVTRRLSATVGLEASRSAAAAGYGDQEVLPVDPGSTIKKSSRD
jgi:hypothetical protein